MTGDTPHPARFSPQILAFIEDILTDLQFSGTILDPFAGVGLIHDLASPEVTTFAIEIEPEWAIQSSRLGPTWCGDFFKFNAVEQHHACLNGDWPGPETWPGGFDAVITSPTYGNRMADHHDAKDGSTRVTYKHKLGREPSENSSAVMQWGTEYRYFHMRAWKRVCRDLLGGAGEELFILNVKNHIRNKQEIDVAGWHCDFITEKLDMDLIEDYKVPVKGMRMGENYDARVGHEHVMVFRGKE